MRPKSGCGERGSVFIVAIGLAVQTSAEYAAVAIAYTLRETRIWNLVITMNAARFVLKACTFIVWFDRRSITLINERCTLLAYDCNFIGSLART